MAKSDQYGDTPKIARCPVCGKIFVVEYPQLYVYKIRKRKSSNNYNYYCCWTHYLADSDKAKKSHYLIGLKNVLETLDISPYKCAHLCNMDPATIYKYNEMECRATMPVIKRIARSLGVPPEELYKNDKK